MGVCVYDRFRDLERPGRHRRLDLVLMATVTNFEGLAHPTNHELRQFAELFAPLFREAGADTRRMAVAALSRCAAVPAAVVRLIAEQPIDVAAPFLVNSTALDEGTLSEIIAGGDRLVARAIARRKALSPRTVADLAAGGDSIVMRSLKVRRLLPAASNADERARLAREETLRQRLRALAGDRPHEGAPSGPEPARPRARPVQVRRMIGFAESREPAYFVTVLADVLDCSFQFAERIMLDISGRQLAETLVAVGVDRPSARVALESFFPHLGRRDGGERRSEILLRKCDGGEAAEWLMRRVQADRAERAFARAPQLDDSVPGAAKGGESRRRGSGTHPAARRLPLRRA